MTDRAEIIRHQGDYDAAELAAIAATFTDCDSGAVCQVAMVVVRHAPAGGHEFALATTIPQDAAANAKILRHAADHLSGGCDSCRRGNERRARNERR